MLKFGLVPALLLAGMAHSVGFAQTSPAVPAASVPVDPRSTPRGSVVGFLTACRLGEYKRAASFLNLDNARLRSINGEDRARELKKVLDRRLTSDPGLLSASPEGDLTDGLDPQSELLGTIQVDGRGIDLLLERVTRDGVQVWLVSASTVQLIPVLASELGDTWAARNLPPWMLISGPLGVQLWQWLALLLSAVSSVAAALLLAHVVMRLLRPVLARTASTVDDLVLSSLGKPIQALIAIGLFQAAVGFIEPPVLARALISRLLTGLTFLALAWLVMRVIDLVAAQVVAHMGRRQRTSASSVVPLGRRTAKVGALILAILSTLAAWGYDTTALIAGLSVGGLAVALAAQKTIENLFGGVAITTDRPVLVGDFCRYGTRTGVVEDIGLRSTRIRTLDRTVVTIPNGQFSSMELENFGRRDKIFFHPTLNLRCETTPDQLRMLIARLREILLAHSKVDPNPARVRFINIGQYSLDIEIFAYVTTSDFDEFLVVQEDLLLSILTAVEEAGTALAVPSQINLLTRDPLTNPRAPRTAEAHAQET